MEKYDHDTFEQAELLPTVQEIEVRLPAPKSKCNITSIERRSVANFQSDPSETSQAFVRQPRGG
jgi:hypothetical protein